MSRLRIRGALVVPMDGPADAPLGHARRATIECDAGRIAAIRDEGEDDGDGDQLDARGLVALPGFVQGHVHLCQTLFRGVADDLPLMPWLEQRIWPLEAAHDADSTRVSAELALHELLRGGTTTVQAMESVRHAEHAFTAAAAAGIGAVLGNCLVDQPGERAPAGWNTGAREALRISEELIATFDGRGRLHYAVSPRFVLACSEALARDAAALAADHGLRVHTHAAEHPTEVAAVRQRFGDDYVQVLDDQGWLGPRTGLAHCVHTTAGERARMRERQVAVLHCPSANLKLGSGIAPIAGYAGLGLRIALGADGAPCNNRMSLLTELRQAALLQAATAGPGAWPAAAALRAATLGGAAALGLDGEVGSLAVGKIADVVLLDLDAPELGGGDVASRLVYAAADRHVRHVVVGGEVKVRDGEVLGVDAPALAAQARAELRKVMVRAGLAR